MTPEDIGRMFAYNAWANAKLLAVVDTLTPEQFTRDLHSSLGSIQGTLVHALGAEEVWLERWNGASPPSFPAPTEFPTVASVRSRYEAIQKRQNVFLGGLRSDTDLLRALSYKDLKGNPYTHTLEETMLQVINHSTHHRGQVITMLRQLGVKPPGIDLIIWFREQSAR